jgi:2-isopropylmalate synthase
VTAIDVSAHDSAALVRVTVSFTADGHEPWVTAGVSSDMNQAALNAIVDGFHYWLLQINAKAHEPQPTETTAVI